MTPPGTRRCLGFVSTIGRVSTSPFLYNNSPQSRVNTTFRGSAVWSLTLPVGPRDTNAQRVLAFAFFEPLQPGSHRAELNCLSSRSDHHVHAPSRAWKVQSVRTRAQIPHKTLRAAPPSLTHWFGIVTSAATHATFAAHRSNILAFDLTSHDSRAILRSPVHMLATHTQNTNNSDCGWGGVGG